MNTANLAATIEQLEAIWSEQVPYRPLSGVMALVIAWLTIGHSSLSAARANPVDTLRSE